MDSNGSGPAGRFSIGRKEVYPVRGLVEWMQMRVKEA